MGKDFFKIQPYIAPSCGFININNKFKIFGPDKIIEIRIEKKNIRLIKNLISLCDGRKNIKEILNDERLRGYNMTYVVRFIQKLIQFGILIDSREIALEFHKYLSNPSPFFYRLSNIQIRNYLKKIDEIKYKSNLKINLYSGLKTNFVKLITKRRSIRDFNPNKKISFRKFSGILYSAYGISKIDKLHTDPSIAIYKRVVPSGGALYPMHIYVVVWGNVEKLSKGVYYYSKKKHSIIKIKEIQSVEEIFKLIPNNESIIKKAILLVIVACNFRRIMQKYANRGYLLALLEAGHIAQNIYLYCTEQNLGAVELASFSDKELSNFLGLDYPNFSPLVTILIGGI
jgi:SagB-type dehydrogenase family enzyme